MWRVSSLLPWGGAIALFVAGCSTTVVNDRSNGQVVDCSSLSIDQCDSREDCRVVSGVRYDSQRQGAYTAMALGCREASCADGALTFATDPIGRSWRFSTTCVPKGWPVVEQLDKADIIAASGAPYSEGAAKPSDCGARTVAQCNGVCRVIAGRRVVLEKTCLATEENVGCSDGACGDGAITYARAPNGDYWQFSDGCTPKGWDELEVPPQTIKAAVDRGACQ
jgi:hypothetical protein